jgi:hydrogenase assembly chaperone HypC/HupF
MKSGVMPRTLASPAAGAACNETRGGWSMCIGFPSRVTAVDALGATVDTEGRRRRASTLLLSDVEVGDWVYVAAGTIVERIDAGEAALIRESLLEAMARPTTTSPRREDPREKHHGT